MNINFILSKINLRKIMRIITFFFLGNEVALLAIFLLAGEMREASMAFALAVWITLALFFESIAYRLKQENEELEKFLNTPPVDSKGGEVD
jgi:hypothetical protein